MVTEYHKNTVVVKNITSFDICQTLECGQCFRWQKTAENTYYGIAFGKSLTISQQGTTLIFYCAQTDFDSLWCDYFDLNTDYDQIRKETAQINPLLDNIQKVTGGIRILHQDSWETLCSFILSQNNNIPRIKGIIQRLCENFGEEINNGIYTFPSAEKLCGYSVEELAVLRSGFRAGYIADACRKVADGEIDLEKIRQMPTEQARTELMKIKGVGKKVADCTMLFGMGKKDCFPVDVWIKKAMTTLFPDKSPQSFGKYGGIVQQYIYYYSRLNPCLFK